MGTVVRRLADVTSIAGEPEHLRPIDVALSFASEQRYYVDVVSRVLRDRGVKVFYDEGETATLWGVDGIEHFSGVYGRDAFRVVMFISEAYVEKGWPTIERRAALGRLIEDPSANHILAVRFDDTPVPGLDPQRIFVRADQVDAIDLATLILEHLTTVGRLDPAILKEDGRLVTRARLVSFTSMAEELADDSWVIHYRIENRSDSALDGVVVVVADPGAEECRPGDQVGCAIEAVVGVVGPGQVIEGTDPMLLSEEPAFVELPYRGSLIWTDIDDNHWMVNGSTLTRRLSRARTC